MNMNARKFSACHKCGRPVYKDTSCRCERIGITRRKGNIILIKGGRK